MESKVVIYGLGAAYVDNENKILKMYNVVACCDQDIDKVKLFSDSISRKYLQEHIDEYDVVLVTPDNIMAVVDDLTSNLDIPIEKIRVFAYDNIKFKQEEFHYLYNFFGEHQEDAILILLLEKLGIPLAKTTYLEIGTNDPVFSNNTFSLYKQGARGVLVDPLDVVALLAQLIRKEDKVITAAVAAKGSCVKMSFFACDNSALSSLEQDHHLNWKECEVGAIREKKVSVIGINELLQALEFIPDLLLIDAEGEDEKILRAIDYKQYRPKIIVVEVCHNRCSMLIHFMKTRGYRLYTIIKNINAIFVLDQYVF